MTAWLNFLCHTSRREAIRVEIRSLRFKSVWNVNSVQLSDNIIPFKKKYDYFYMENSVPVTSYFSFKLELSQGLLVIQNVLQLV